MSRRRVNPANYGPSGDGSGLPLSQAAAALTHLCQVEFFLVQQRVALHQHGAPEDLFDLLQI